MASYMIHLAIAEEYLRKNPNEKEEHDEFMKGAIYPDTVSDKTKTHYAEDPFESNVYRFLQENEVDSSFKKGHFLHVLTDYMFYNRCIESWSEDIYIDYDILDEKLVKKYNVSTLPYDAEKYAHSHHKNCELKILNASMVDKFIHEISEMNLNSIIEEIKEKPEKWTKIRKLKIM